VATELTSTTITNILEAVPGIKNVLRSPAADAMVNLSRAAAGIGTFDIKDARELLRFAFRRGLINNEEHDRVLGEVEGAAVARESRLAARRAARDDKAGHHGKPAHAAHHQPKPHAKPHPKAKAPAKKVAKKVVRKPAPKKPKAAKKAKPSARPKAHGGKPKKRR